MNFPPDVFLGENSALVVLLGILGDEIRAATDLPEETSAELASLLGSLRNFGEIVSTGHVRSPQTRREFGIQVHRRFTLMHDKALRAFRAGTGIPPYVLELLQAVLLSMANFHAAVVDWVLEEPNASGLTMSFEAREVRWQGAALDINHESDFRLFAELYAANGAIVPFLTLYQASKPQALLSSQMQQMATSPPEVIEAAKHIRAALNRSGCPYRLDTVRGRGIKLVGPRR